MSKTTSISEKQVIAYVKLAPISTLKTIGRIINSRLTRSDTEDSKAAVMRSMGKSFTNSPMPSDLSDDSDDNSGINPGLMAAVSASSNNVDTDALRARLEAACDADKYVFDGYDASLLLMWTDRYGNGIYRICDDDKLIEIFEGMRKYCIENSMSCPYGQGRNNDLLKIKNRDGEKGKVYNVVLKTTKWDFESKSGFSCYAN